MAEARQFGDRRVCVHVCARGHACMHTRTSMSALRSASTVLISIVLSTSGMAGSTRTCRNQHETTTAFCRCTSSEEHSAVTPAATRPRIPPGPLRQPEPAETCQTRTRAAHMRVEPSVARPYV